MVAGARAGTTATAVLALDPGRNVGAAWVRVDGVAERLAVLTLDDVDRLDLPDGATLVVGNGTGSAAVAARLRSRGLVPELVDEEGTTLAARELYFRDHPARGLARLLPRGLRSPPRPVDDYAAYAIALRWLAGRR